MGSRYKLTMQTGIETCTVEVGVSLAKLLAAASVQGDPSKDNTSEFLMWAARAISSAISAAVGNDKDIKQAFEQHPCATPLCPSGMCANMLSSLQPQD